MRLADTAAIAFMLGRPSSTIRSWAHRGWLTRRGTGARRSALYDVDEALQLAAHLATLDNPAACGNTGTTADPVCPDGSGV